MICLICRQADLIPGLASVIFERGELRLAINSVPANVCSGCGEAYVDEDVAMKLIEEAEEMSATGVLEDVMEYSKA